jgi:hypothetical protein
MTGPREDNKCEDWKRRQELRRLEEETRIVKT